MILYHRLFTLVYRVKIHGIPGIEVHGASEYSLSLTLSFLQLKLSEKLTAINKNKLISLWGILMDWTIVGNSRFSSVMAMG